MSARLPSDPIDRLFARFPLLEAKQITLRRLRRSDAQDLFAVFSDDEVTRHYDLATFEEADEALDLIDFVAESYAAERQVRWAIELRGTQRVVGTCGFVWLRPHSAEIGYDLARKFWGQGIMYEALTTLLTYAFEELTLNRIEALVIPANVRSRRLLERLGFVHEGTLREYDFFKDAFHDMEMYALLRRDWMA